VQGSTPPAVAATRTGDALTAAVDESTPARAQASLVDFFRQASPYIAGHRNRTFVVVLPGEVVAQEEVADGLLADVALVHSLGVRLVLVVGCSAQIDSLLAVRGLTCGKVDGVRVTDAATMQIAMEAAGKVQLSVTAALGKGPPVFALRKHGEVRHGGPAVRVACGNFVAAKRRGVVAGVDFGDTGDVRYVDADAINVRLDAGDVVVLSNLGNSAAGEVLNCLTWDVAARAALQLHADKLLCFASGTNGLVRDAKGSIVRWLQLQEAEACLTAAAAVAHTAECDANALKRSANGNGGGTSLNAAALSPLA
jgi:amino-acid N-acetyltransferase